MSLDDDRLELSPEAEAMMAAAVKPNGVRAEMHSTAKVGKCQGRGCTATQIFVVRTAETELRLCDRCVEEMERALALAGYRRERWVDGSTGMNSVDIKGGIQSPSYSAPPKSAA